MGAGQPVPPLHFCACSTFPHLPFDDRYFDLIFATSVFTHISELADAWLLELRRILRPGGLLLISIQDQGWIEATRARTGADRNDSLSQFLDDHADLLAELGVSASTVAIDRGTADAMVLHDRAALTRAWSALLEVVGVHDQVMYAQSAILLRRRPDRRS